MFCNIGSWSAIYNYFEISIHFILPYFQYAYLKDMDFIFHIYAIYIFFLNIFFTISNIHFLDIVI